MIDNETLLLLGRVKRLSKKVHGIDIDAERVANDAVHAKAVLSALTSTSNDDLFAWSVALMNKMGFFRDHSEIVMVGG